MLPDILLHLDSYPNPTPQEAIDQAVRFCAAVEGKMTAVAVEIDVHIRPGWLANQLAGVSKLADAEEGRSRAACQTLLAHFETAAQTANVFGGARNFKADFALVGEAVARMARTHDLCIVPFGSRDDGQRSVAEEVVFGSARPTLIFRPGQADLPSMLERVVVAWDGSRCAARAMADAMPLLCKAKEVVVFTALNEKGSTQHGCGAEAVRHLSAHGVLAAAVEEDAAGQRIGAVLDAFIRRQSADFLVMGAYGRSRMREFILGGATEHVLDKPIVPLLLSH